MQAPLPEFLQPFQKEAEHYLKIGCIRDIEFSGNTYQVQIVDPHSKLEAWSFLQLDPRGNIKDCFCSCEEGEELTLCPHIAAAYLSIYNKTPFPLHQRFERSLWNQLCRLYADRIGDDPDELRSIKKGHYTYTSAGKKTVFFIKAKTPHAIARLKEIIEQRSKETEETSLKFSNLAQEEINLWREGRPSDQLRYELSFWNDIAHWLMLLQEAQTPYEIQFEYGEHQLPKQITISFSELEVGFYLSEANLKFIIPALDAVRSPLAVHHASEDAIARITYDKKAKALLIERKKINQERRKKELRSEKLGHPIEGWLYVPGDGFYARDQRHLLAASTLTGEQISQALSEHFQVIQRLLEDATAHADPIALSYTLTFDADWNLHIVGYAFSPGDLTIGDSSYFGNWIYLDEDGFYPMEKAHFSELEVVIPCKEVTDFVRKERSWLNLQEGFHVHLASIETQLTYALTAENKLTFSRLLATALPKTDSKDFDSWVYISGQGFYAKSSGHTGLPIQPDIPIQAAQIPLFIRMNASELQLIPGFFSEKCPVNKARLNIELDREDALDIKPEYELLPEYVGKDVRFFDEYVFVNQEGFHELPGNCRLPERYRHQVHIASEQLPSFFESELPALQPHIEKIDPRLETAKPARLEARHIALAEEQGSGWYSLKLGYAAEDEFVSLAALWAAINKKKHYLFSAAGRIDVTDKCFDWIRLLPKGRMDKRSNVLLLSTLELMRLHALEELKVSAKGKSGAASQNLLHDLTELRPAGKPDISGMKGSLRAYQELGLHWLWFLYEHGLSGLLCDDMGLGKTHQAMALFAAIINHFQKQDPSNCKRPHFLVICPTSVIYHWQEKLANSLPNLRVCVFYGSERSIEAFHEQYDVLLTSYGIWRIENERLQKISFEVAIFDEIQIAKNHNSRIHNTLVSSNAKMRLGMTGTPIENHLRELKSLFDIVLPTYMPNDSDYRDLFVRPIEKDNSRERKQLLSRLIQPFVLRRKKRDVLPDLPEKTEEIAHCDLLPDQQFLYTQVLNQSRENLILQLQDPSAPIPYIHIFAVLASLKQICNHPAAYLKQPELFQDYRSGKWDLFVELLSEARDSQQKVVVFSQYLAMLDIFANYLNEIGVGFAAVRGATINRGEQIHRFNNDPSCEVFLGSLQAVGLGVDLTAGSVVIHYDRWWNAARENQATDRVHRIGQTRGVQVFKLVTKGTFEERIDVLITKKAQLMEDVVGSDDHRILKQFDREELLQLLQEVSEIK